MPDVAEIAAFLEQFAPARLAADWDNVGLLIGDAAQAVTHAMTCLTITPESVAEAVAGRVNLIVTHHPFPFKPLRRITGDTAEGRMLLDLIAARIAVYSPHTAFDSAAAGINQQLCTGLQLTDIRPLTADAQDASIGTGRLGTAAVGTTLDMVARRAAAFLKVDTVQLVGAPNIAVSRVAVACGSAGDLLTLARQQDCDCFVTGEARFHTGLEAQSAGVALLLLGHYASERFAVEQLADVLANRFAAVQVWASRDERDPIASWHAGR